MTHVTAGLPKCLNNESHFPASFVNGLIYIVNNVDKLRNKMQKKAVKKNKG
jgi:hypothetical protein